MRRRVEPSPARRRLSPRARRPRSPPAGLSSLGPACSPSASSKVRVATTHSRATRLTQRRPRTRAPSQHPPPGQHRQGARERSAGPPLDEQPRERAAPAQLVAAICRARVRQERGPRRRHGRRPLQARMELQGRLVSDRTPRVCHRPVLLTLTRIYSDVSRMSNISVSAYLRTAQSAEGHDDMGNDILMARVDLTPQLDGHVSLRLPRPC